MDLSNGATLVVFDLWLQGNGLALNQSLQVRGRPFAAGSLAGFWSIDARLSDGHLVACLVRCSNGVAVANRYEGDRTRDHSTRSFRRRSTSPMAVPFACLEIHMTTLEHNPPPCG